MDKEEFHWLFGVMHPLAFSKTWVKNQWWIPAVSTFSGATNSHTDIRLFIRKPSVLDFGGKQKIFPAKIGYPWTQTLMTQWTVQTDLHFWIYNRK
jgi:hypothetical protein